MDRNRIYRTEEIEQEIRENIDNHECCLKALQNIQRLHKKDGKDFANFERNFSVKDKSISHIGYDSDYFCYRMTVNYCTKMTGYQTEYIELRKTIDRNTNIDNIDKSRIINERCLLPYYRLNVEETEQAIKDRIEYEKTKIKEYKKALKIASKQAEKIEKYVLKINEILKADINKNIKYDLEYFAKNNMRTF